MGSKRQNKTSAVEGIPASNESESASSATSKSHGNGAELLGKGRPPSLSEDERDRRDITIKPRKNIISPSEPTRALPSLDTFAASRHAQIPSPTYVRSQPIGLLHALNDGISNSPTISGGVTRRMSLSRSRERSEELEGIDGDGEINRPLFHRSESLPAFPKLDDGGEKPVKTPAMQLRDLPLNPKNWSPTQLSLYLSTTTFSLHPLLANDITAFIKSSFLSGRVFLRLQDVDFEEMGVNVKWRTVLGEARVTLKRESATQGGKIWGFEGGRAEEGFAVSEEVATDGEDEVITREEWKKSWKKIKGKTAKSRGRVKGMASVFESDSPTVNRHHHRSDSATSSISASSSSSSIVEKPEIDEHSSSPTSTPMTSDLSNSTTRSKASGSIPPVPPLDGSYQSAISQHTSSNINPYGLVRKPSAGSRRSISGARVGGRAGSGFVNTVAASGSRISTNNVDVAQWQDSLPQGVMEEGDETVKSSSSAGRESKGTLQQLFNLEIKKSSRRSFPPRDEKETSREREKAEEKDSFDVDIEERDVLTRKFGNGTGSMVLVKRSQLEELGRRMEEVELQLQLALAPSRCRTPSVSSNASYALAPRIPEDDVHPGLGKWLLSAFSDGNPLINTNVDRPATFTALGGYMIAASIGIGIVAGEVVVSKLPGFGPPSRR